MVVEPIKSSHTLPTLCFDFVNVGVLGHPRHMQWPSSRCVGFPAGSRSLHILIILKTCDISCIVDSGRAILSLELLR